jgi:hypothetical protein
MSIAGLAPPNDWELTVPQSNVAVVRQISVYYNPAGIATGTGRLKDFEKNSTIVWVFFSAENPGGQQFEGRWVFGPGSIMQFITDSPMDVTICGYWLDATDYPF